MVIQDLREKKKKKEIEPPLPPEVTVVTQRQITNFSYALPEIEHISVYVELLTKITM